MSEELQQLRLGDGEEADGSQHERDTAGAEFCLVGLG